MSFTSDKISMHTWHKRSANGMIQNMVKNKKMDLERYIAFYRVRSSKFMVEIQFMLPNKFKLHTERKI